MVTRYIFQQNILVGTEEYDFATGKIKAKKSFRSLPCIHLGAETGEKFDCVACGGQKQIPTHSCALHGRCSKDSRLIYREDSRNVEVAWCRTCKDYLNAEGEQDVSAIPIPPVVQGMVDRVMLGTTTVAGGCCCGGSGGGITTLCCDSPTPTTLHATFSGDFASEGTVVLTWNAGFSRWQGNGVTCFGLILFTCNSSTGLFSLISFNPDFDGDDVAAADCNPFLWNGTLGVPAGNPCHSTGSAGVVITN